MTEVRRTNLGGACCFKCLHRQKHGRACAVNPLYSGGDAGHTCDLFTLDKARWHDLRMQTWEWELHIRKNRGRMTLEDFS